MDSKKEILQKIEQPLAFAYRDQFKNLSHIKDLGKSLLHLLPKLKESLLPADQTFNNLIVEMMEIFTDYDWQKLELKKTKIEQAVSLLTKIKSAVEASAANIPPYPSDSKIIERVSELKDDTAKLNLPVQYLKGVGPKMAARFAAKKIATVEDLLYFLPRTYEDLRQKEDSGNHHQ